MQNQRGMAVVCKQTVLGSIKPRIVYLGSDYLFSYLWEVWMSNFDLAGCIQTGIVADAAQLCGWHMLEPHRSQEARQLRKRLSPGWLGSMLSGNRSNK